MALIRLPKPAPKEEREALGRSLSLSPVLAELLWQRGHREADLARRWLDPKLEDLEDPMQFRDMERAVERIRKGLYAGERILIHGDYDVDGLTGTVLLLSYFRMLGAEVDFHIPARGEGYAFSETSVARVKDGGFGICISVDSGTASIPEIAEIQEHGCDVIVTDHHHTGPELAPAYATLNPRLEGSTYPFPGLAGVGVAFKLAWALSERLSPKRRLSEEFSNFLIDAASLVALGSVADVVPLIGENRILVRHGLRALVHSQSPGIRALIDILGHGARRLAAEDVSFRIGPRLNAAGRMGHAKTAVELLCTDSYGEARRLAQKLEQLNKERQRVEAEIYREAEAMLRARPQLSDERIVVAAGKGWHLGVLGIVAARLADRFQKPAIALSITDGRARGSGRSHGGIDLKSLLDQGSEPLTRYGGHAFAVGMELPAEDTERFAEALRQLSSSLPARGPQEFHVDVRAPLGAWSTTELKSLARFRPFGEGNRPPRFLAEQIRIGNGLRRIGPNARGLCFTAIDADGAGAHRGARSLKALAPGLGYRIEEFMDSGKRWNIVYTPRLAARVEGGPVEILVHAIEDASTTLHSVDPEDGAEEADGFGPNGANQDPVPKHEEEEEQ